MCQVRARHSFQAVFAAFPSLSCQPDRLGAQTRPKNCQTQLQQEKKVNYEFHYFHNSPQEEQKKEKHQIKKKQQLHNIEGI